MRRFAARAILASAVLAPVSAFAQTAGSAPFTIPTGFDAASLSSSMFAQVSPYVLIGGGALAVMGVGIAIYKGLTRKSKMIAR